MSTVEHLDGEKYMKLTKSDSPDGQHHWLPTDWVETSDDKAVYLNKTQEEIMKEPMVYHCKSASNWHFHWYDAEENWVLTDTERSGRRKSKPSDEQKRRRHYWSRSVKKKSNCWSD